MLINIPRWRKWVLGSERRIISQRWVLWIMWITRSGWHEAPGELLYHENSYVMFIGNYVMG